MSDSRRIRVCIVLEGSYPFITGGVSAWVHDLIINLPDIDFALFTISPSADQDMHYDLPPNIVAHNDIVLSAAPKSHNRPKKKKILLEEVENLHSRMFSGATGDISEIISKLPEGYFMHTDSVMSETGWKLITESNSKKNPLYSFTDYFWAWKSAHDMLFTTIGSAPPEADIYHAVSTGFAGMAALAAKIRYGKPLLLTEHGLYHKEREMEIRKTSLIKGYQRDMWISMYNMLSKICYKNADVITALFEENRRKQHELGAAPENTFVVPNGIDIERFSIERKPREKGYHIGLVGRVVPIKDIKTFIATAKMVLDVIPEAEFHCIGPTDEDPAYYEDCKLLVQNMKIQDSFYFTGRQNVLEYYSFLDVVMLTSVREAQPLVILEAYCALVPVVSTKVGNIAEMLDYDERLLAPSKDSARLAEGVIFLHNNPSVVDEMRVRNRQKVLNLYNKEELHQKFRRMYNDLIPKTDENAN
ncbi:MAG: GT4 family glycosyltransferase PelF [Spirochaetales bacterium]|jgi:polysaccharide biosynthesis protein PelF|nr:GT4 family glycosyltransferase PelF [Spirochaetales bacterium]